MSNRENPEQIRGEKLSPNDLNFSEDTKKTIDSTKDSSENLLNFIDRVNEKCEEIYVGVVKNYQDFTGENKEYFLEMFSLNLRNFITIITQIKKDAKEDEDFEKIKEKLIKGCIGVFEIFIGLKYDDFYPKDKKLEISSIIETIVRKFIEDEIKLSLT